MAHYTIYKAPQLGDFGTRQFDSVKKRLHKVARKFLLPAGYEFQQIASDFLIRKENKPAPLDVDFGGMRRPYETETSAV